MGNTGWFIKHRWMLGCLHKHLKGVCSVLFSTLAQTTYEYTSDALPTSIIIAVLLLVLVFYLLNSYLLYRIGRKLGYAHSWYAWVPILNVYMMVDLSYKDTSTWFLMIIIFMFLCGIVSTIMLIIVWMNIAERCGKDSWWGILTIIPIANFVAMYVIGSGKIIPAGVHRTGVDYIGLPPPARDEYGYPVADGYEQHDQRGYPPQQPLYPQQPDQRKPPPNRTGWV